MRRGTDALLLISALAFAVSWPGGASAQEARFAVTTTLQPRAATLGEYVRLTVTVRHATDLLITTSEPERASDIELVAAEPAIVTFDQDGSAATTTHSFVLAAFQLGNLESGDVRVSWLHANGSAGSLIVHPPILRITAVRAAGDHDLRPLKPQAVVGGASAWREPSALPFALVVLLVGITVVSWWWRRRRGPVVAAPVSARAGASAEDRARACLDQLQGRSLADRDTYDHFYGVISLATRQYLAERYGFNASALTTIELAQSFDQAGVGRWQARLATGLLERCDAAVYARSRPDPTSADHDLTVAYEVVELSRPRYHGEQLDEVVGT